MLGIVLCYYFTIRSRGFCFFLHLYIVHIFSCFCLAHVNRIVRLYDEIRLISLGAFIPIDTELLRDRS